MPPKDKTPYDASPHYVCAYVCATGYEVSDQCRVRTVHCQEGWRCGLWTATVTEGQRVDLDCMGQVMEAMGRFSWRYEGSERCCLCSSETTD